MIPTTTPTDDQVMDMEIEHLIGHHGLSRVLSSIARNCRETRVNCAVRGDGMGERSWQQATIRIDKLIINLPSITTPRELGQ